jgi:RHS repeat-associated protein
MEKRQKYVCSYDQAGNLVKTIPPAGVNNKHSDAIFLQQVAAARLNVKNGQAEALNKVVPTHTLITDYRYNTLNQVAAQQTPDAGKTTFWYDLLGRLAVSQNSQQALEKKYSYTLYDALGRIIEVGQKPQTELPPTKTPDLLQKWLAGGGLKEQITRTSYDLSYYDGKNTLKGFLEQRNLRNRVSYSMVFDKEPDPDVLGTHSAGTFYSYDIHGNVDTLLQDFNEGVMKATGNRFKKIAYDYDLISGKVNKVAYQAGNQDEFYHRYFYDAENRLTDVYTSRDSLVYEKDSRYAYYKHGPLARSIIGQNQVQGIDYAYTLQGWLKGVNSTNMAPPLNKLSVGDMGADGYPSGNVLNQVARDAFGFALHYYSTANAKDYKPIGGGQPFANAAAAGFGFVSLYNGNIAAMSVNTPKLGEPLLTTYKYDQLQRLTKVNTYKGLNPATNNWNVVSIDDYREELTYDANGNIQTYKRNGTTANNNPLAMDNMNYNYYAGTNKLNHVKDAVPKDNYPEDLDNQETGNYKYDAIGNLISDSAENIKNISWNVYGKMQSIDKKNGDKINYGYDAANNRISETFNNETIFYVRDASGNTMSTYIINDTINKGNLTQSDVHLYGSSRLGIDELNMDVHQPAKATGESRSQKKGSKKYELTDHRGNVMAVVGAHKTQHDNNNDGIVDHYTAQVLSANDSYSFGLKKPFRTYGIGNYAYSYNGKKDDKKAGRGYQNYGMREYDKLTSRFISVDPITDEYPELTPYQFASNRPIDGIDLDGLEFLSTFRSTQLKHFEGSNIIKQQKAADLYQQKQMQEISARASRKIPDVISEYREPDPITKQQRQNYKERALDNAGRYADGTKKPLTKLAENKHFTRFAEKIAMPIVEFAAADGAGKILFKGISVIKEKILYTTVFRTIDAAESNSINTLQKFSFGPNGSNMKQFWTNEEAFNTYINTANGRFANGFKLEAKVPKFLLGKDKILNTATQVDEFLFAPKTINSATINGQKALNELNKEVKNIKITKE